MDINGNTSKNLLNNIASKYSGKQPQASKSQADRSQSEHNAEALKSLDMADQAIVNITKKYGNK